MAMDKKTFGKLQTGIQVVIGIALLAFGTMMMLNATAFAAGDFRFLLLFFGMGVLYIATAIPQLFEYAAAALQEEKEQDALAKKV
jgi:Na+/H+ antiporter NhaD/arsenite permease-like protein